MRHIVIKKCEVLNIVEGGGDRGRVRERERVCVCEREKERERKREREYVMIMRRRRDIVIAKCSEPVQDIP
jgi:hypothetical protein